MLRTEKQLHGKYVTYERACKINSWRQQLTKDSGEYSKRIQKYYYMSSKSYGI